MNSKQGVLSLLSPPCLIYCPLLTSMLEEIDETYRVILEKILKMSRLWDIAPLPFGYRALGIQKRVLGPSERSYVASVTKSKYLIKKLLANSVESSVPAS